ncbi:hypothetical protein X801_00093 [Opisthorchis viverrini]|uniref:Kinesin-like domain-containing protein n=1 Tax=Opisthorchis viverrini TaxID=6198 RepID=A0A1S8XBF9_OPIVI|nr:hypothetical protein X801_00093 [Opisthorchis viverrini]
MVPLLIPGSAPVPSTRLNAATPPVGYNPVPVDRLDEAPCQGVFLIHQGLQRRIAVTLVYEVPPDAFLPENSSSLLLFQDVHEVVIGRVRDTAEWLEPDSRTRIISLSLLPARYFPQAGDDRQSVENELEGFSDGRIHEVRTSIHYCHAWEAIRKYQTGIVKRCLGKSKEDREGPV